MKFSKFNNNVQQILAVDLPSGDSATQQGRSIANDLRIGRTAFMNEMGVDSELEYKERCIRDKIVTFHAHIGLSSWGATAEAMSYLNNAIRSCDHVVDRAGICLDRRMGLPRDYRDKIPAETGPMLETESDWMKVGRIVPIQPHMG
ncbi:MAG: hypothetical protein KJP23_29590, partial [Deltaproteobacteria bacterium]|nr:hypothetical protein [Deltaproteobacteria bacterium]